MSTRTGTRTAMRIALAIASTACDGPVDPAEDAGASDTGTPPTGADAGPVFDPTMTYPGEGDRCEFSLFCRELQICVDQQCARHERFTADDLEVGEPVRIPHETLRTSTLYGDASFDWDEGGYVVLGGLAPGSSGPTLVMPILATEPAVCPVVTYGQGPPEVRVAPDVACTAAAMSPYGHLLVGGTDGSWEAAQGRLVLIDPEGSVVMNAGYPEGMYESVAREIGNPNIRLFNVTSLLWYVDRFLFSASAGEESRSSGGDELSRNIPERPTHVFFGQVDLNGSITLRRVGSADGHAGSYGWLVRDEQGVRALMMTYTESDTDMISRVDVLDWGSGERETLVQGADGLAGLGRYAQPNATEWHLSVYDFPGRCRGSLFHKAELIGTMTTSLDPCVETYDPRFGVIYGANGARGPFYVGHPTYPWLSLVNTLVEGTATREFTRDVHAYPLGHWHTFTDEEIDGGIRGAVHGISRFGKTVEIFGTVNADPVRFAVWESRISRRVR